MFQATQFAYQPAVSLLPNTESYPRPPKGGDIVSGPAIIAYLHVEPDDMTRAPKLVTRAAKNIKWLANKAGCRQLVLHSFSHLSEEKAEPNEALSILTALKVRLENNGYDVSATPFGYSCSWTLSVQGEANAKVFKAL